MECYQETSFNSNKIYHGDALTVLKTFENETIDCCVTSPPYWALRDYKTQGQLGLEPTFHEYIGKLCDIFNEVKRVLKKTGTCWVVLGDTYGTHTSGWGNLNSKAGNASHSIKKQMTEKSLCMIPERFAITMIDNGWILRNKIVWYKPNCMPSSAKDRFTVDWEYVFFFVKRQRYFFETQHEPVQECSGGKTVNMQYSPLGRIKRCVWKISTKPFSGAHFAVFPPDLVEPMIKAGCPKDGIVLDPFIGAGTTALVAMKQQKKFVGIELNHDYIEIANKRLVQVCTQKNIVSCILSLPAA